MNAALQCMLSTVELLKYFVTQTWRFRDRRYIEGSFVTKLASLIST